MAKNKVGSAADEVDPGLETPEVPEAAATGPELPVDPPADPIAEENPVPVLPMDFVSVAERGLTKAQEELAADPNNPLWKEEVAVRTKQLEKARRNLTL